MEIIKYDTRLTKSGRNILKKIDGISYSCVNEFNTAYKITKLMNDVFDVSHLAEEYTWIIALNAKCKLIGVFEVSHGTIDASIIGTREIFVRLCLIGATQFVLVHNHPSQDSSPSQNDYYVTEQIKKCGEFMKIPLADHIILGKNYYSFRENNVIVATKK